MVKQKNKWTKSPIIGVVGSGKSGSGGLAHSMGRRIAENGFILLTGGGPGVMEEASRGAHEASGLVIGVLPSERKHPMRGYPNKYVDIPIYTGLSDARNAINAKASNVIVALGGGAGTLSEIALAIKSGTPVIGLACPTIDVETYGLFVKVPTVEEAIEEVKRLLKSA